MSDDERSAPRRALEGASVHTTWGEGRAEGASMRGASWARPHPRLLTPRSDAMSKRILIVDDEDHIREVAATSLEMVGGWEVLTAESGQEGIARAEASRPDAVLLDVMMPDMDGIAAFHELQARAATRGIPVILLTAKVQPADRRRFESLGVTGVIAKPFDPLALPEEVADALSWAREPEGL